MLEYAIIQIANVCKKDFVQKIFNAGPSLCERWLISNLAEFSFMNPSKSRYKFGDFLFRYRGVIPVLLILSGVSLRYIYTSGDSGESGQFSTACLVISLIGVGVRLHVVGHSPKGTSGRNKGRQLAHSLNTTGWYAVVRHPLYFANFLIWVPIILLSHSVLFSIIGIVLVFLFYHQIILTEESFLSEKFGEHHARWKQRTPQFFPNPMLYSRPSETFNLRKVIRKEKNGIAALFLVYFLFEFAGSINSQPIYEALAQNLLWTILMVAGGLYYLIVKVIAKKTNWLNAKMD